MIISLTRTVMRAGFTLVVTLVIGVPLAMGQSAVTNPHWKKTECLACHTSETPTAEQLALKAEPGHAVCGECHDGIASNECRHRSDITVTAERLAEFDAPMQAAILDNSVKCTTCHNMQPHCTVDIRQRYQNPSFVRGGPFEYRGDQCFACHDKAYRQPSPHRQGRGTRIKTDLCIFCHGEAPEMNEAGEWLPVQYAIDEPLSNLCSGCHDVGPHPSSSVTGKTGWVHMTQPLERQVATMERTVSALGGKLPLDPVTGEMTCATCHDPHDARVDGFAISESAGAKARLRFSDMCGACHDK